MQEFIIAKPPGGVLVFKNGVQLIFLPDTMKGDIPFSANLVENINTYDIKFYRAVKIEPLTQIPIEMVNKNFGYEVTVPLSKSLPVGKRMDVLTQNDTKDNWIMTDEIAVVLADGKTAQFKTRYIGTFILVDELK